VRAAVYSRYGPPDVVQVRDVAKPVPKEGEVLVRIHASTVAAADWRLRKADPFFVRMINGLAKPKKITVLGMELAGTIEALGPNAARFEVGDHVFGTAGLKFGAHAEYLCLPQHGALALKPDNMPLEQAAAVLFGAVSALHFLRKADIQPGQKVLIYGASGSVGVFAVQLAKHFGAHVTGVCSAANLDLVRSLGADKVVDYAREDFSQAGRVYDVIFDTVGKSGFGRSMRALKRGGVYAWAIAPLSSAPAGMWASLTGGAKVVGGMARAKPGDLSFLKGLIEAGKLRTVIDRRYPLEQIAEAHRHAEAGHKKGHVVILMGPGEAAA
jgi:NADPH:quinone reductase-like Zn-dependent oxidoreductase